MWLWMPARWMSSSRPFLEVTVKSERQVISLWNLKSYAPRQRPCSCWAQFSYLKTGRG